MSATRNPLTDEQLDTIAAALGTTIVDATLLTGGLFAVAYHCRLGDGTEAVVKSAPLGTDRLLRYEVDLMHTEVRVLTLAGEHGLPYPRLRHADLSRTVLDADYLVMDVLPGTPWNDVTGSNDPTDGGERFAVSRRGLGATMARLHTVTAPGHDFGYPNHRLGLHAARWSEAFELMMAALSADAADWAVPIPSTALRAALARHRPCLDTITVPTLVHFDLWPGNVFLDPGSAEVTGIIDAERALWGDPLMDFVGAEVFALDGPSPEVLAGYRDAGGTVVLDDDARIRLDLYRLYLITLMRIEIEPRATSTDRDHGYIALLDGLIDTLLERVA